MEMATILVTGANRGLGRATAAKLVDRGHALIVAGRDRGKIEQAAHDLARRAPGASVEPVVLDLASLASVRVCAEQLAGRSLDAILNSAGVMQQSKARRVTGDGCEETLQTNVLAPFLLTRLLLPTLARSSGARIVNVTSRMHMPGSRGAAVRFDFDDPQLERGYDPDRAYKNSKLAMLWFSYELARRLVGTTTTCNAVCPGFVPETAADSVRGFQRFLLRRILVHMPFANSVDDATEAFVEALVDPGFASKTGKFFADHRETRSSDESLDVAKQAAFWALASRLTGLPEA
jgi:retinol dehydrogenase-12